LVVFIALLTTIIAFTACAQSSNPQTAIPRFESEVPRITVDKLWQNLQSNADILIIDTRDKEDYTEGHIEGAIAFYDQVEGGEWRPPEGKQLVLY
jgi:predicted sulfurtransferase